ncbi:MAG TPA: hypothetical protein VGO04_12450 [Ensifer sp.]|jgi:hypothetical protein|uniref:hypothetical protein n=1 Tax=Ensifer sp. TaxID=1872086 RepID=UPI002E0FED29|nr:hypothetical protein [Ensifer sp.]
MQSILAPTLQAALEAQALREGLLTRDDYVYGELHDFSDAVKGLGQNSQILSYLCLFPEIEGTESEFRLEGLASRAGFQYRSVSPRIIRASQLSETIGIHEEAISALMTECHDRAYRSFEEQRNQILPILHASLVKERMSATARLRRNATFYTGNTMIKEAALGAVDLLTNWYARDLSASPWGYGIGFEEALAKFEGIPEVLLRDPDFELWLDKLDDFYVRHFATIFWSAVEEKALAAGSPGARLPYVSPQKKEEAAGLAALVSVSFRDELRVVPDPRGIEEAIEMANSREMSRLRERIFEWLSEVGSRDPSVETRIRADIKKASREIKFLARYKELNASPWFFTAKLAIGRIPVLGDVVSVLEYGLNWYESVATQKNIWVSVKEPQ